MVKSGKPITKGDGTFMHFTLRKRAKKAKSAVKKTAKKTVKRSKKKR